MNSARSPLCDTSGMSAAMLRTRHANTFGSFTPSLMAAYCGLDIADAELREEWLRLVAEELLLAQICGLEIHPTWKEALSRVCPFAGRSETLEQIDSRVRWVACVPLIRKNAVTGAIVRIWGLHGADQESWVEGRSSQTHLQGSSLRLGGWDEGIAGHSWQLGAALAARTARESRGDLQFSLACNWLITGAVSENVIEAVQAGNKTKINTHRRWMIPEAGHDDFSRTLVRTHRCATLDAAWSHLSGEGTIQHDLIAWPEPCEIALMHATVSKAIGPLISSIMLSKPSQITLWHSPNHEESAQYADRIIEFLQHPLVQNWRGWKGHPPSVRKCVLPDADLVAGENALRAEGLHQAISGIVLFNITGGNLIMKLAAYAMARLNPSLWLIYREQGIADAKEVILLRNASKIPLTGRMRHHGVDDEVNWTFLCQHHGDPTVAALVAGTFRH